MTDQEPLPPLAARWRRLTQRLHVGALDVEHVGHLVERAIDVGLGHADPTAVRLEALAFVVETHGQRRRAVQPEEAICS